MFVLRITLAGIAALFAAMWLQLDVPRWAIWTVFIVSPPVRGNALRKTVSRLIGTFSGCVAGVAISAVFPQDRFAFYSIFSIWLGACAYWATLRRGYISYGAILAAFTSAIISADVASAPLGVWRVGIDRCSATVIGVVFAFFASEAFAKSDSVSQNLVERVRMLTAAILKRNDLQDQNRIDPEPSESLIASRIYALDEMCMNALAEKPALERVRHWIVGLPQALLSLQLASSRLRSAEKSADSTSASENIAHVLSYLQICQESILTGRPPTNTLPLYPRITFPTNRILARINFARSVVGIALGFAIWNATEWHTGDVFMVNLAVALVLFVALDNPVAGNWMNIVGNAVGGVLATAMKYLVLIHTSQPETLVIVILPALLIGASTQTKPALVSFGIFFLNGFLILLNPTNPQQYDFVADLNILIALFTATAFVPVVFQAINLPSQFSQKPGARGNWLHEFVDDLWPSTSPVAAR